MPKKKTSLREHRYVTKMAVWVPNAIALIEGCRYDACYPDSETESHKIERLMGHSTPAEASDHIIFLTRVARTEAPPTFDRWRSFASHVLRVWHPEEPPPTEADLQAALQYVESEYRSRR